MLGIRSEVSGERLELSLPSGAPTSVAELRSAVAAALGIGAKGVVLLCHGEALQDDQDLPPDPQGALGFVVAWGPPAALAPHILRPGHLCVVKRDVAFPEPQGIQINMMPFVIGDRRSLPWEYQHYWDVIQHCPCRSERGSVGFLTIHEGLVRGGESQRRGGLHVDMSGAMASPGAHQQPLLLHWGRGIAQERYSGGIYMASSVSDSCEVWDARIDRPEEVLGRLGDAEHLRELLGPGTRMRAGELYWLSDVTPHESLPLERDTYRQYFRLVTSQVSVWYRQHSTANRLGIECDPAVTRVCTHDKFSGGAPQLDPADVPDDPYGEEYLVDLSEFDNMTQDLGLRVHVEPDPASGLRLRVWYVTDGGIVWHWNKMNPSRGVAAKCLVLEVNGLRGEEFQALLGEIRKTGHINGCRRMRVSSLLIRAPRPELDGGGAPGDRAPAGPADGGPTSAGDGRPLPAEAAAAVAPQVGPSAPSAG